MYNKYPMYMEIDPYPGYMLVQDLHYDPNYITGSIQESYDEDEYEEYDESDREYMKSLYPELSKRIQNLVEDECDKLEYEGSIMYDEYPDKKGIDKIVARIYTVIEQDQMMPNVTQEIKPQEKNVDAQQQIVPGRNIWLWNGIQVPFLNEFFYRRGRRFPRRYGYPYPYQYQYQYRPYRRYRPYYYYQPYVPYYYRY